MIVFDAQALQSEAFGERGVGRYTLELARVLAREQPASVDVFAWNDALPWSPRLDELGTATGRELQPFSALRGADVDVLHVNAPFDLLDFRVLSPPVRAARLVVTCYDLIPYLFPEVFLRDPTTRARYVTRLGWVLSADAIVADSAATARDVIARLGVGTDRVTVIGAGTAPVFVPPDTERRQRLDSLRRTFPELADRFVLVPSGMSWNKNVPGAIAAYGRLPEVVRRGRQLVIACDVEDGHRHWLAGLAAEAGIADEVLVTGYVAEADLVSLYQTAELVLFPSYYEGFGLPVLEARRCGARVICADRSSLPEVLPDRRARFDPWDVDDIVDHLVRALTDVDFQAVLDGVPDPGFAWSDAARQVAGVYDGVRPVHGARRSPDRCGGGKRLGVVTILPPTPSGVADHSSRLVRALHDEIADTEVHVFADGPAAALRDVKVSPLAELPLEWHSGRLDAVLYCVGNSPLHRDTAAVLPLVPGHVLMHDVRLHHLTGEPEADALGSAGIASSAISVLVQSEHARQLLAADSGVAAIDVGPHPCEGVASVERIADDGGLPWIVSAGIAHETKASGVVAEAFALLVAGGDARTALVGEGGERFTATVSGVVATGRVDDDELDRWLRRAALVVQLRATSNGESSGIAAHAMARGVPLLVSDLGAMRELPVDAVERVPVDITAADLAASVQRLLGDTERMERMRAAGLAFAQRETPAAQARRIVDAIFNP